MTNIREVKFVNNGPQADVVEALERWLQLAKDGKIQAVALAGVKPDRTVSTEWRGLEDGALHEINSAVAVLQYRILRMNVGPEYD